MQTAKKTPRFALFVEVSGLGGESLSIVATGTGRRQGFVRVVPDYGLRRALKTAPQQTIFSIDPCGIACIGFILWGLKLLKYK